MLFIWRALFYTNFKGGIVIIIITIITSIISTVISNILFLASRLKIEKEYEIEDRHIESLRKSYSKTIASAYNLLLFDVGNKKIQESLNELNIKSQILISNLNVVSSSKMKKNINLHDDYISVMNLAKKTANKERINIKPEEWLTPNTKIIKKYFKESNETSDKEEILKKAVNQTINILYTNASGETDLSRICEIRIVVLLNDLFMYYISTKTNNLNKEYSFKNTLKKILQIK